MEVAPLLLIKNSWKQGHSASGAWVGWDFVLVHVIGVIAGIRP
jgi:hypothetical protein